MHYLQKAPIPQLSGIIKSFWMVDSENDATIHQEKIIPDGYPEMIFHYHNPYRARINKKWHTQSRQLIAGQISNHFFLENTGLIGTFAIKFQPWALSILFNLDMSTLKDKVVPINKKILKVLAAVKVIAIGSKSFEYKSSEIEKWFIQFLSSKKITNTAGERATQLIIEKKGDISIRDIQKKVNLSERSLERYFFSHIGLSPKFYSRVIRFAYIFQLAQVNKIDWLDIVYQAGFYDQSHFIRNFKEFTGEDPSTYGFSKDNLANLFLRT